MTLALALPGQLMTFLTILGAGFLYIVTTSIAGMFGAGHDHDISHDAHAPDSDHDTISIFSPKVVAIFLVSFGGVGAITTEYGLGAFTSTLAGFAAGVIIGGLALAGMRLLHSQRASSEITKDSAVGLTATVVVHIPVNGFGEVGVNVRGTYLTYQASGRGQTFPRNTQVRVLEVVGSNLIVGSL